MDDLVAVAARAQPLPALEPVDLSRLSVEARWSAISMHKDHCSNSYIARKLQCNRRTVHAILERYKATGSPGSGSRSGRPRKLSEPQNENIVLTALEDKFTTPRQIVRKLDLQTSKTAIGLRLCLYWLALAEVSNHNATAPAAGAQVLSLPLTRVASSFYRQADTFLA